MMNGPYALLRPWEDILDDKFVICNIRTKEAQISLRQEPCVPVKPSPLLKINKIKK